MQRISGSPGSGVSALSFDDGDTTRPQRVPGANRNVRDDRMPVSRGPQLAAGASSRPPRAPLPEGGYQVAMPIPESLPSKAKGVDERIAAVSRYVEQAASLMEQHAQQGSTKIFSAPEYFFDAHLTPRPGMLRHRGTDVRQLSEPEYHQIDVAMRELSNRFPDILIKIPIAWKKPMDRPETQDAYLKSKAAQDPASLLHAHYQKRWTNKEVSSALEPRAQKAQRAHDDGLAKLGPRFSHDFPKIAEDTTHLARNTVLTYWGGKQVNKYHKVVGMQEVLGSGDGQKVQFVAGSDHGGAHVLPNGSNATQEICRDHAVNTANSAGAVHFVNSDGVAASNPAGKYDATSMVIHANAALPRAGTFGTPGPDNQKVELVRTEGDRNVLDSVEPMVKEGDVAMYNVGSAI